MPETRAAPIGPRWLVAVRWGTAATQILATLTLALVGGAIPLVPALATIAPTLATNAWLARRADSLASEGPLFAAIALDVVLLSVWLVLAGGPSNPWSAFFLVDVVLAALLLREARPWLVVAIAALGYGATFFASSQGPSHAHGGNAFDSHLEGMYVAYVVASVLVTFFVTRVAEALRTNEAALRQARERSAHVERVAALTTLAAGAAHELGSPLGTIAVAAKELERALAGRPELADLASDATLVRDEVGRCRAILDRMAMRAGHLVGSAPAQVSLRAIGDALDASLGADKASRVHKRIDDARVMLPEHAVATIVENLVRNALDASTDAPVELDVTVTGGMLRIVVVDRGDGMDEATKARALDPFFTTKEPGQGMGLGLFLVDSIAHDLGGTVAIESEKGHGTRVEVRIGAEAG